MQEIAFLEHSGNESHLLREIYRTHQMLINTFTRVVGISASRLTFLRLLVAHAPAEMGIMDMAKTLEINPAAVTRLAQEMEEKGWIERRADPTDRRRTLIRITDSGRDRFLEIHARMHEIEKMFGSRFERQDIETTVRVLSEVREALELVKKGGPE